MISKSPKLKLNEVLDVDVTKTKMNIEDICDLFRGWVQNVQMQSLQNKNLAIKNATICYNIMTKIIGE